MSAPEASEGDGDATNLAHLQVLLSQSLEHLLSTESIVELNFEILDLEFGVVQLAKSELVLS